MIAVVKLQMHQVKVYEKKKQKNSNHALTHAPRREKAGLRGFRPVATQTGLYSLRRKLES